jgi:hypothetical protein
MNSRGADDLLHRPNFEKVEFEINEKEKSRAKTSGFA